MIAPATRTSSSRRAIIRAHCTSAPSVETSLRTVGHGARNAPVRSPLGRLAHERARVATRGGNRVYGRNRRVLRTLGACLVTGAVGLGGAGAAQAQTPLPDTHNVPANAVTDHVTFMDNTFGTNGNMAAANFIDYGGELGDFMFGDGTGGLSIWSLKDPAHPAYVARVTAAQLRVPGDTQDRFYEGENMTVDAKRKLVILSRDPRGFGGTLQTGQTGFYVIDVKDPYNPKIVTFKSVPAGHTATCINDCQYLWSMGPYQ